MAKVKGIVMADLHLGALPLQQHQKDLEFIAQEISLREDIKFGVICGDYFDYKTYASSSIFRLGIVFLFELMRLTPEADWYILEGTRSHDAMQGETMETVFDSMAEFLKDTPNENRFHYIKKVTSVESNGLKMLMIPEEYVVDQDAYYKESFSHYYDFIFGHGMTDMMYYAEKKQIDHVPGSPVFEIQQLTSICNYCFFGHVHTHKVEGRFESIGPISRWEFGNEDAGFDIVEYDTETEVASVEYVTVWTAPIMHTVNIRIESDMIDKTLDKELNKIILISKDCYKLRLCVSFDQAVTNMNAIRVYISEYFDKYSNIFVIFKQGSDYYEEDGTQITTDDEVLVGEDLHSLFGSDDSVTVQDYIEKAHGDRIGLETIQTVMGYKGE